VNILVPAAVTDPLVVSANNIIVGTMDSAGRPLPVQNLTVTAGTALPGAGQRQSASASLEAAVRLEIFLTGNMELTGGSASAGNQASATSTVENSAAATVGGLLVDIRGLKNSDNPSIPMTNNNTSIVLRGGNASASRTGTNLGIAKADASAVILAGDSAIIDIGGDFAILGGTAAATSRYADARAIAGTEIGTQVTSTELLTVSARNMYISGGTGTAQDGGVAEGFGSLASSGAISIVVAGDDGLVLAGGSGSGMFDEMGTSRVRVTGQGYPIDVTGRIQRLPGHTIVVTDGVPTIVEPVDPSNPLPDPNRQNGLVIAGAPLVDESLLAAFLRATEAARDDTLAQDPSLQTRGGKGPAGVCK
jgi:hypothetical protein